MGFDVVQLIVAIPQFNLADAQRFFALPQGYFTVVQGVLAVADFFCGICRACKI
jgi:hypothetical protein